MKRILLLALALCLLLPALAVAECPVTISGTDSADAYLWDETARVLTIKQSGLTLSKGTSDDFRVVVESGVKTLTLYTDIEPTSGTPLTVKAAELTLTNVAEKKEIPGRPGSMEKRNDIVCADHSKPAIRIEEGCRLIVTGGDTLVVRFGPAGEQPVENGAPGVLGDLEYRGSWRMEVTGADGRRGGNGITGNVRVSATQDSSGEWGKLFAEFGNGTEREGNGVEGDVVITSGALYARSGGGSETVPLYGGNGIMGMVQMTGGALDASGSSGMQKGGAGMVLTGDSAITGDDAWKERISLVVSGGNDPNGGQHAIRRQNGAKLRLSGYIYMGIVGGTYMQPGGSFRPDIEKSFSAALESGDMLKWQSPLQMKTAQPVKQNEFLYENAVNPGDLTGKYGIMSFKGYRVTYDANGGKGEMPAAVVPEGEPYTVENTCAFTREYHEFAGWQIIMGGQVVTYAPIITVTDDVTVKAMWKPLPYTITFDTDGGSGVAPITQDYGTPVTAPESPKKEGFVFHGWDQPVPETMPGGGAALKAIWAVNNQPITDLRSVYGVSHYLEQEDGTYAEAAVYFPLSGVVGEAVSAEPAAYTGYTLNAEKSVTSATLAQAAPGADGAPVYTQLTLYYDMNRYTVDFDVNGGEGGVTQQIFKEGELLILPECTLTPPQNMVFGGWEVNGVRHEPGAKILMHANMSIKAIWVNSGVAVDPGVSVDPQIEAGINELPKTGDDSAMALWAMLLALCGAAMAMLRRRRAN